MSDSPFVSKSVYLDGRRIGSASTWRQVCDYFLEMRLPRKAAMLRAPMSVSPASIWKHGRAMPPEPDKRVGWWAVGVAALAAWCAIALAVRTLLH